MFRPFFTMEKLEEEEEEEKKVVMSRFLGTIRPPNPEDAGLEDCALPIESIMEAFSRAAASLNSRIVFPSSAETSADGCDKAFSLNAKYKLPAARILTGGKELEHEGSKDEVVVIGAGGGKLDIDRVVVLGESGDKSDFGGKTGCTVDGKVFPGTKNGHASDGDLDEDDENKDGPRLIEELI